MATFKVTIEADTPEELDKAVQALAGAKPKKAPSRKKAAARKPAAEPTPEPEANVEPETPPAPTPESTPTPEPAKRDKVTAADVREALRPVSKELGKEAALKILHNFGASNITAIDGANYPEVIAACKAVLESGNDGEAMFD